MRRALGRRGEELAAAHFERLGFSVIGRNVRTRYGEIDLIAFDGRVLAFVEVVANYRPWTRPPRVCRSGTPRKGGGASGLTALYAHRSGGETQAEDLRLTAAEVPTLAHVDFAIVTAQAVDSAARPGRGQASQTTQAVRGTGLRHSSMYPSVLPQGEAGGDEAEAKAPRQIKHDRGWSEFPMSHTYRSRPRRQHLSDDRAPRKGGRSVSTPATRSLRQSGWLRLLAKPGLRALVER
jgi:hypothetical protein